jgi:hypothetical protein
MKLLAQEKQMRFSKRDEQCSGHNQGLAKRDEQRSRNEQELMQRDD